MPGCWSLVLCRRYPRRNSVSTQFDPFHFPHNLQSICFWVTWNLDYRTIVFTGGRILFIVCSFVLDVFNPHAIVAAFLMCFTICISTKRFRTWRKLQTVRRLAPTEFWSWGHGHSNFIKAKRTTTCKSYLFPNSACARGVPICVVVIGVHLCQPTCLNLPRLSLLKTDLPRLA